MEKILTFEEGNPLNNASCTYRFQCNCLSTQDAMDIDIENCGEYGKFFIIRMDFLGTGFWDRIKYALQIVRGHWSWREFVVRDEDAKTLSDIFNPDKRYSELPER